jgi:hypothetical protein
MRRRLVKMSSSFMTGFLAKLAIFSLEKVNFEK